MDKDKLRELAATLTEERDALIQQVNARIAFLNGKIEMIQELLREAKDDDATE
jgi:hypothetical protein